MLIGIDKLTNKSAKIHNNLSNYAHTFKIKVYSFTTVNAFWHLKSIRFTDFSFTNSIELCFSGLELNMSHRAFSYFSRI